jgi:hypothetical protein
MELRSSSRSRTGYFCLIVLISACLAFQERLEVYSQTPPQNCPSCPPPTEQTIYAPTIGLPEATGSEIVLNCRSAQVMTVRPTFYTVGGEAITGPPFAMQPSEMRFVTVESLIPDGFEIPQGLIRGEWTVTTQT